MTLLVALLLILGSPAFVMLGAPYLTQVIAYLRKKLPRYEIEVKDSGVHLNRKPRVDEESNDLID